IVGALTFVIFENPAYYIKVYVGSVALFLVGLMAFALIPNPVLAGFALLAAGFGGSGFGIMQVTLIFHLVAPEMRARVFGLLSVAIGMGLLGFFQIGFLAGVLDAQKAVVITGLEGLLALLLTMRYWRAMERRRA